MRSSRPRLRDSRFLLYSIVVHAVVLALLFVNLSSPMAVPRQETPDVVHAVALDEQQVVQDLDARREAEEQARREEQQRREAEEEARREEERQRQLEEQRRQEAEEQRQQEAEEQQRREEEQRRQAEQERQQREEERRRQEEEQRRLQEEEEQRQREAEEQRRQEEEERRRQEEEERRRQEEAERRAEEERRQQEEAERQRREEEERRQREREEQAQRQAEEEQLARQAERARSRFVGVWADQVRSAWTRPPGTTDGLEAIVRVRLLPDGEVQSIEIQRSSGDSTFDRSVEQAIRRASPLQVPDDSEAFRRAGLDSVTFRFSPDG